MSYRLYCLVSGVLFSLVAIAHLLRVVYGMSVQVYGYAVPMLLSWFGFIVPGALAVWGFRAYRGEGTKISP